jgi:serine phosphatase RsbU (regulator of sigma subunit)
MGRSDTLVRTGEFEIKTVPHGSFIRVLLTGRVTDQLLGVLQNSVFLQVKSLAIDAGALSGITMAFARAVYYAWQAMKAQGEWIVLVNPPDSLRGFLKLLGAENRVPVLLSETQLPALPQDAPAAAEKLERELQQLKRELETNVLWQYTDREFCWVCPFCAELQPEVKFASRVSISQQALERVWRHLNPKCRSYNPGQPRYRSRADLEAKVRQVNQEKMASSKDRMEALETKVTKLQERAQWAANLEKGMKVAASRQRKLLPTKAPQPAGCEIAFTYRPAEELSGDFYDFVEMSDDRVAFVIGDVSGHGIEAGILMGMTKKVLSIRLGDGADPVEAVKRANQDIVKDLDRSSFVTAAVLVYDPKARTLTSVRAGHNPPILYNPARGPVPRRFEAGGLMIGMAQPAVFDQQLVAETLEVQPGDVLLLYTDGLEEGKNTGGEEFGLERIVGTVKEEIGKPAAYLLGALFYAFDRFAGTVPQEDDLTAVCVKFK